MTTYSIVETISVTDLTETDKKALDLLEKHEGYLNSLPSQIGFLLFPDGSNHRHSQGLVLCGMKVMRRLEKKKLIKIFPAKQGFTFKLLKK